MCWRQYELHTSITGRPVLDSLAVVRLIVCEATRSHYDHAKSEAELGCTFRSTVETLAETVASYRANFYLPASSAANEHS
jgi:dihydroflavonol-4-reductase